MGIRFIPHLRVDLRLERLTLFFHVPQIGELVEAVGLGGPHEAKEVRAREGGGPPVVTDGPFGEAKEYLAGFWILDVRNVERVIEIAARISTAPGKGGAPLNIPVEVRPIPSQDPSTF